MAIYNQEDFKAHLFRNNTRATAPTIQIRTAAPVAAPAVTPVEGPPISSVPPSVKEIIMFFKHCELKMKFPAPKQ